MGVVSGIVAGTGAVEALGRAAVGITEVFRPNETEGQAQRHESREAALRQLGAEFALDRRGLFDRLVDGLNRLPRPMLAMGTLGLFVYAMADPVGFSSRMEGLGYVPEPLWWLLGAIVGFYVGGRELHYRRNPAASGPPPRPEARMSAWRATDEAGEVTSGVAVEATTDGDNAALEEWRRR